MRQLLISGSKNFKITIPDDAKITFGPWSAPRNAEKHSEGWRENNTRMGGTLRIYEGQNVIACFSNVTSFRDLSIGYAEEIAREEGATLWKDDEHGYVRENTMSVKREWVHPQLTEVPKVVKKNGKGKRQE